jgi:hypothetical protein
MRRNTGSTRALPDAGADGVQSMPLFYLPLILFAGTMRIMFDSMPPATSSRREPLN